MSTSTLLTLIAIALLIAASVAGFVRKDWVAGFFCAAVGVLVMAGLNVNVSD